MFETHGILCRHTIRVLDQNLVHEIPEKYILRRWRKDVPRKHSRVKVPYHDPTKTIDVRRYDSMMNNFDPIASEASLSSKKTAIVVNGMKKIKEELADVVEEDEESYMDNNTPLPGQSDSELGAGLIGLIDRVCTPSSARSSKSSDIGDIKDPPVPKKKGRQRTTRYKSPGEKGWKKSNESKAGKGKRKDVVKDGKDGAVKGSETLGQTKAKGCGGKTKGKSNRRKKGTEDDNINNKIIEENQEIVVGAKLQVRRRKRAAGLSETADSLYNMSVTTQQEDVLLSHNEVVWNQDG